MNSINAVSRDGACVYDVYSSTLIFFMFLESLCSLQTWHGSNGNDVRVLFGEISQFIGSGSNQRDPETTTWINRNSRARSHGAYVHATCENNVMTSSFRENVTHIFCFDYTYMDMRLEKARMYAINIFMCSNFLHTILHFI